MQSLGCSESRLTSLVQSDAVAPAISPGVDNNPVREGVRVTGCNGRDMILVSIDDVEDLQCCLLEHVRHGFAHFRSLCKRISENSKARSKGSKKSHGVQKQYSPDSVRGVAMVTSSVQISQHTSSSPFPANPPNQRPERRRFFS